MVGQCPTGTGFSGDFVVLCEKNGDFPALVPASLPSARAIMAESKVLSSPKYPANRYWHVGNSIQKYG